MKQSHKKKKILLPLLALFLLYIIWLGFNILRFKTYKVPGTKSTSLEIEGVFQILDENKLVIYIKGTINLRRELEEQLATNPKAKHFMFEEAQMFTMRESELLQQFLQKYGKLPEQNLGLEEDLY